MFVRFKGMMVLFFLTPLFLIIGIISVINITGGIRVSQERIANGINTIAKNDVEVKDVHLKIGFNLTFIASNFKLKTEDIEIKAETFGFQKSIFSIFTKNTSISNVFVESAEIKIALNEDESNFEGVQKLAKMFPHNGNNVENIHLVNATFIDFHRFSKTTLKIKNFIGDVKIKKAHFDVRGTFNIGNSNYNLHASGDKAEEKINFKLESENISLKVNMQKNVGKTMLSINNLTKFLNDITPDTVNFNLARLDGKKNIFYIESDIAYNEVRKDITFSNSKIQIFDGSEEAFAIENLGNHHYKVVMNIPEINVAETFVKSPDLKVNESKVPLIQFSSIIPNANVSFDVNVKRINIKTEKGVSRIDNFYFGADFAYGKSTIVLDLLYNNKVQFRSEGLAENFETEERKAFFRNKVLLKSFNLSDFKLTDNIKLKLGNAENISIFFDYILSGDNVVVDDIFIELENGPKVLSSKFEYNLYNKNDYIADLNIQNLDFKNIKLLQGQSLNAEGGDLFRILFDYLKFKQFSYINFNCFSCNAEGEKFDMNFKLSVSGGKIELEDFNLIGGKIDANADGVLDVRNPQSNILNLSININKWEDFNIKKLASVANIFDDLTKFRVPSLESFSGMLRLRSANLNNKFNKIETLDIDLPLNAGIFRVSKSEMKINGLTNKDFIKLEASMLGNVPTVSTSFSFVGFQIQEALQGLLKDDKFDSISGFASIGVGVTSRGFLLGELIKNASADIQLNSKVLISNFNVEGIVDVLMNENLSFKQFTNAQIQERIKGVGKFDLTSTIKFANMEFVLESAEIKSANSNSLFVGKLLLQQAANSLQILGKTAMIGANLNAKLKGAMPIYITESISSTEENSVDVKMDYSQINKYSEARRVLYK